MDFVAIYSIYSEDNGYYNNYNTHVLYHYHIFHLSNKYQDIKPLSHFITYMHAIWNECNVFQTTFMNST